jgi:hypothetical protein
LSPATSPTAAVNPICRHCAKSKAARPRGLCRACYSTPGVKDLYPPRRPRADRGGPTLPAPTQAPPGTPEKLAVLEQRANLEQAMFHPADARYAGDPRPEKFLAAAAPCPADGGLVQSPA